MSTALTNNAMLVSLSIHQWTARKLDKSETLKVNQAHGSQDRARVSKLLVSRQILERVKKAYHAARNFHYEQTLPWHNSGARILPRPNFDHYTQEMNKLKAEFLAAVDEFLGTYEDAIEEARVVLNGLFKPEDYPPRSVVQQKFAFAVNIDPVPESGDWRVDLGVEAEASVRADIDRRAQEAQDAIAKDLWGRVHKVVEAMAEKLSLTPGEPGSIFRDSLVGNVRDLAELLPRLNVSGDSDLDKMVCQLRKKLGKHEPDTLRTVSSAREETAKAAREMLAKMSAYTGA